MLESLTSSQPFEYKKLSKEEMEKRGILGRLVGIIADYTNPTRNGRLYKEKLWDNVFSDPIMKERIENRCCFGELGHPTDREETDLSRVAICLAEQPVKKNGKLYGVFDILNNANGQILKTLCDYGCNIGISSRGSGDLETDYDGQESVNPDTYDCQGWDAVLIPAVKTARLQYVTEALDKKRYNKTLRDKLSESISKETSDNQKVIKESLDTLGIKLDESQYKGYDIQPTAEGTVIRNSKGEFIDIVPTDDEATEYVDSLVNESSDINEALSFEKDYSDIPLVNQLDIVNSRTKNNLLPGIFNVESFVKAFEATGYNKFKIRTTRFGKNVSYADIKDDLYAFKKLGWNISKAYDSSLSGFNEIYIVEKIKSANEPITEAVNETGFEYRYGIYLETDDESDKFITGDEDLEEANTLGIEYAEGIVDDNDLSVDEKIDILSKLYMVDDDFNTEVKGTFSTFLDNAIDNLKNPVPDLNEAYEYSNYFISSQWNDDTDSEDWIIKDSAGNLIDVCNSKNECELEIDSFDDDSLNESIPVGTEFENEKGKIVRVEKPTSDGKTQISFLDKDGKTAIDNRLVKSDNELINDLKKNGYKPMSDKNDKKSEKNVVNNNIKQNKDIKEDINQEIDNINNEVFDEANDDGALVEELQKALELNKQLDSKITSLQEKLSVCYTKEIKLQEQLDGYKQRVVELSKKSRQVEALNVKLESITSEKQSAEASRKKLSESIKKKDSKVNSLTESISQKDNNIKLLQEQLQESKNQLETQNSNYEDLQSQYEELLQSNNQLKESYKQKLDKQNNLIEKYQNIAVKSVNKYIDMQAVRLGVKSSEIKNRLPESYSFSDIDAICEDLQEYKLNISNLPFATTTKLNENMKISAKNVDTRTLVDTQDDSVDNLTLRLAGLM